MLGCRTLLVEGKPATLAVETMVSTGAQSLIWEEFFRSRHRGIDWNTHLPWATPGQVYFASLVNVSRVVVASPIQNYLKDEII